MPFRQQRYSNATILALLSRRITRILSHDLNVALQVLIALNEELLGKWNAPWKLPHASYWY